MKGNGIIAKKAITILRRRGDGRTLDLDFTTGVLDSRITFSRTSLGTYVHSDGLLYGADTSTSSQTIGSSGTKTFTLAATAGVNRRYAVGDTVIASSGVNNMSGTVTSYDPATQVLVFTATSSSGSGTLSAWIIGTRMARFDHDPSTLAPRGLLVEGQAVNLVVYSSDYVGSAGWFFSGSGTKTATDNYATAPDGTTTAGRLQLGQNCALKQLAGTAGVNHTVSFWVKSNTGSSQTMAFWTGTGAATRTVTTSWTRIEAVINFSSSTAVDLYNPNATDCDILIWGAQLETGSGASSYIPTGASQGTRAIDEATMTSTNFSSWFNASTGTLAAYGQRRLTSDFGRLASINDNTANESLDLGGSTTGKWVIRDGGSDVADITPGTVTANTDFKIAGAYAVNDAQAAFGGTLGTADTSLTLPTVDRMMIGRQAGTSVYLNGTISRLIYWPLRLPNATLQSLTQ